jgi:ribosomal protein L11 methyltransferase
LIRLAVRCAPAQAEAVLAELTVLAPNGVEEERGPDYVEYALYGGEGELPELGEIEAAAGDGLVEVVATEVPDDWADRWRDFHRPILVGDRLWVRPSWTEPDAGVERKGDVEPQTGSDERQDGSGPVDGSGTIDVVVDPGRAFGTGAHQTTRLCLELLLELEAAGESGGELTDLGCGSGVLAIAAAKLGWGPVSGYDHEPEALEAAAANAAANDVELALERVNLRERLPALAPTVLANMTSPVLIAVAGLLASRPPEGSGTPRAIACSGILPAELDEVAAAFAAAGLAER